MTKTMKMMKMSRGGGKTLSYLLAAAIFAAGFTVNAENNNWIGSTGGTYSDAANWSVQAPAAGVTSYVTNKVTNPFATGTTGLLGTLDLGGSTQTLSSDPDNVFNNGAVVSNGTLKLTSTAEWAVGAKIITFGAGLSATSSTVICDNGQKNNPKLYFVDGCSFVFSNTKSSQKVGYYRDSGSYTFTFYVKNRSRLEFSTPTLYLGCASRGKATIEMDNSTFEGAGKVVLGGRLTGSAGTGTLKIENGSVFNCTGIECGTSGYAGTANITFKNSTLVAERIARIGSTTASLALNNLTFAPKTSGKNLFDNLSSVPITGTLTISNTVGNVTIGSVVSSTGAFKLKGGKRLDFTAAPTYTGATTIEDGTLSFGGLSHGSKVLTVGEKGVLATDANDTWATSITFEKGAKVLRTTKDTITLTAPTITGIPDVGEKYVVRLVDGESSDTLTIKYRTGLLVIVQ